MSQSIMQVSDWLNIKGYYRCCEAGDAKVAFKVVDDTSNLVWCDSYSTESGEFLTTHVFKDVLDFVLRFEFIDFELYLAVSHEA